MECRDAVALELLHERTVLRRVPPCGIFPVVVAQQPLVVAADPERAVVPDRDGVDEFAQRLFAEAWHLCEILFIGEADVVSAVGRTDPDVALAVAESAAEVARVVEFVEPVYDVAVEGVVREVDRMEVVALRADVDRAVVCRSQYRDVESGGVGQTPQQPGVGRGTSRCGVEGHDALLRAEPDTALPVAASAAEPRRTGQDRRVADLQFPVVLEDAPSVGAAAPEKALPVGLQHQRTVVFRIFPEQCLPAGGVEEHHSRGSRADDLPPVADDMMQAAFGQQAFEIVVQRVVEWRSRAYPRRQCGCRGRGWRGATPDRPARSGNNNRFVRCSGKVRCRSRSRCTRLCPAQSCGSSGWGGAGRPATLRRRSRRRRAATPGEACVRRSGRRWGRVDVGSGSSVVVAREAFL